MIIPPWLLFLLFVQQPVQTQLGSISGQLRDNTGMPVPGLRVFAVPVETDAVVDTLISIALADSQGRYHLEGVPPGRYLIGAGLLDSPTYYPGVVARNQGQILTLAAGQTITNVNFAYAFPKVPPQLSGRIELDDGSPLPVGGLPGFRLILASGSARWATTQPFTNQQGLFFFQNVAPAEYSFTVAPLPLGYYLKSLTYGNVDLTRAPLNLKEGLNATEIKVVLTKTRPAGVPPGVRVSGRITDRAPLTLMAVTPVGNPAQPGAVINPVATVTPREDGYFEIEGVPPGRYMLLIRGGKGSVPVDVAESDVTLNLVVRDGAPVILASTAIRSITGTVEVGSGTIPTFELGFSTTQAAQVATHTAVISGREFAVSLPDGEYRIIVSGLPSGYTVESVVAGPLDLTQPFLVTYQGIADRFTANPIVIRSAGKAAISAGITVRLKASP